MSRPALLIKLVQLTLFGYIQEEIIFSLCGLKGKGMCQIQVVGNGEREGSSECIIVMTPFNKIEKIGNLCACLLNSVNGLNSHI